MKRTLNVIKTCQCCGRTFAAKTAVTRYCSIQCRNKAYYRNLKGAGQKKPDAISASCKPKPVIPEPAVVPAGREYMKVAEAAALLGVCKQTVYNMGISASPLCAVPASKPCSTMPSLTGPVSNVR